MLDADGSRLGVPALIAVVGEDRVRYLRGRGAERITDLGLWLDPAAERVLLAPVDSLRSLLARLALVAGYRSDYFELVARFPDPLGDDILLWRVRRWE
jgi:hypothetical protein